MLPVSLSPAAALRRRSQHRRHTAIAVMALAVAVAASSAAFAASGTVPAHADNGSDHPLALASTVKIDEGMVAGGPGPDNSFGVSAVNLGDLDGDGATEFAVGAPGVAGQSNTGSLYILFTDPADGSVKRTAVIGDGTPNGPSSLADGSRFGHAMANLGDLDGDGTADLAVGASGGPIGPTSTGDLFVVFLNPDGSVKRTAEINDATPNGPSLEAGDRFGTGVANMGDLDGDGTVDLAVTSTGNFFQGIGTGGLYVLFLNPDGSVKRTVAIDSQTPNGPPSVASAEFFGVSAANIGDLDGDGTADLAVGAAARPTAGVAAGSLYIMFMNADGTVKRTAEVGSQTPNAPSLADRDRFGWSAAGAGDLDGDGTLDIAVGALGHGIAGVGTGELYVMLMNADGTVKRTAAIDGTTPNGPPLDDGDRFGASISNMGDLDGDGRDDLAVGTFGDDILHFIFLNADGTVRFSTQTDSGVVSAGAGATASDRFGSSVASLGDLDGDGVTDMAVGAPGRILGHVSTGDVYIAFMNPNGTVKGTAEINSQTPNGPSSLARDDRFGSSVASLGDLDGDGVTEIAAGATGHIIDGVGSGSVYVMFMNADGSVKRTAEVNSQTPNGPSSLADGDRFGSSVAGMGDLDGDGVPDMAAGAIGHYGDGHANVGDVYVMFMNADGSVKRTAEINSQTPNGPSLAGDDRFGSSVAGIGDLDGDGVADMAAGATGHIFGGVATGDLYVMLLNPDGSVKRTAEINPQTPNGPSSLADGDLFGSSVAGMGDLDGDGVADIAVGATGLAVGDTGTAGELYVMFMNADGSVKRTAAINSQTPNGPLLAGGDRFGSSVASLGDLDGDGGAEIAVGSPGTDSVYVSFASADQSGARTVEIGALIPMTKNDGPHRAGEHRAFAVNTAVSDFNAYLAGTGAQWRLSVDVRDSQGLPATTLRQAMDMHGNDGINFIVGPSFSSGVGAIITDYINPGGIADLALVSPSSTSPKWALDDNVYRLAIADDKGGSVIAGLLSQEGKKSIIPVWVNDPFGTGLADATVSKFRELGGVADYSDDPASGQTVRSYDRCSDTYTTCIEDQFPGMVDELADAVTAQIREYGSDRVAVVFVGFELPDFIAEAASGHPVLRTVQWVGSDADVLDPLLVIDGSATKQFMADVDFRTYVFAGSVESPRYLSLTDRLTQQFPDDTFSTYTYSSYDTVWAVGLAMEAAGGPDSGFAAIAAQIKPAVDGNDGGTLGDITLNEFGDIESGDYLVWGIEPTGWERIGTYTASNIFVTSYDDPVPVERIGGLLSLGPTGVSYLDDEYAVIMALAELDFNANNPSAKRIDVRTIDTSLGALPALHTLHYGTYDSFYYPQLARTTDAAMARYAADGSFDAVTGSVDSGLYPFGFDLSGRIAFHGSNPANVGQLVDDLVDSSDREVGEFAVLAGADDPPAEMWWQYFFVNPDTGTVGVKRSLLVYHEPSGLIVGTGYYPIVGGDREHRPALEAVILEAERLVSSNGDDVTSLSGTYDGVSSPFYPFVLDTSGNLLAGSLQTAASVAPTNVAQLRDVDMTVQEISAALQADGDTVWLGYTFYNPATGLEEPKRSLLKQVTLGDGTEYIFASGYYPADPIRLFAGPTTSQNLSAILPYVNADASGGASGGVGIDSVAVSPSSSANFLAVDDNAFRLTPTNSAQVPPLIDLMGADGISHVVVVPRGDAWASDLTDYLVGDGSFEGYSVTAPIPISDTAGVDYAGVAAQLESQVSGAIAASGGDAGRVGVVYAVFDREMIPLLGAIDSLDRGSSPVFMAGHYGTAGVIDVSTITDDAAAARVASELGVAGPIYAPPTNPASRSLAGALAALGIEENPYHRAMYDSVSIIGAAAAAAAQSPDRQYSVRDVLADSAGVPDSAGIFPYAGAMDDDPGITLNPAGDIVAGPSDYQTFAVVPSGDGYAWQNVVPGGVSGTVYADVNNNAARDAGEPGIAGVAVTLVDGAGTAASTVTGADGGYSFAGAAAGPVLVQAAPLPPLHKPSAGASSYAYGVLAPTGGLTVDFALFPVTPAATATVAGKVYGDANGNTVFDGSDSGIAGVPVFVVDFLTLTQATALTDAAGDYSVPGVLPDSVLVQAAPVPAGFLPAAGQQAYRYVTLGEGATAAVDFVLSPVAPQDMASVAGTVYQDNNGNGVRDAGEPGIPGSVVFVFELLTAQQQTALTDADGAYSFAGVLPDAVLVQHAPRHESVVPTSPAGGFAYLDLGAGQRAALDFANSGILPSPVDTLQAAAFSDTRIDLVWEEPAMSPASDGDAGDDRITGYRIEAESPPGSGFETVTPDTGTSLTWFYHTGLEPGTQYSYRVMPITEAGTSSASNVATAVTGPAR